MAALATGVAAYGTDGQAARFVAQLKLDAGHTLVVAEGDGEARSTGSYAVRLYSSQSAQAGDDTTFYVSGLIEPRDGAIECSLLDDLDGDGKPELVVIVRSVGTGQYLSAQAFSCAGDKVKRVRAVADLPKTADPLVSLRQAWPLRP